MGNEMCYHLVLEARPRDFMPIDINILNNNPENNYYLAIQNIDSFTKKYHKEEIYEMIKESNIVPMEYLNGNLKIINDNKYRYPVLYKDTEFSLDNFFADNINNKQLMNTFYNVFIKYGNDLKSEMKQALDNKEIDKVLNLLFQLSYLNIRNIYTYILENIC